MSAKYGSGKIFTERNLISKSKDVVTIAFRHRESVRFAKLKELKERKLSRQASKDRTIHKLNDPDIELGNLTVPPQKPPDNKRTDFQEPTESRCF